MKHPSTAASPPPVSNTGVETRSGPVGRPEIGFGWFQGTGSKVAPDRLLLWLADRLGVVKVQDHGREWYRRSATVGDLKAYVAWDPVSSSSPASEVYVVIPQKALDALGWDGQKALLRGLRSLGFKPSRLDVYFDDLARIVDPTGVHDALERGDKTSHLRDWGQASKHLDGGYTTYIGSRTSPTFIRSYRKWAESGDPSQGVRWEGEFKGDRAPLVLDLMLGSTAPAVVFWSLIRQAIDFCDRTGHVNGSEAPLLAWWLALIGSADRAVLAGERAVDSLARRFTWLTRQAAPSLALVFHAYGSACISDLIAAGYPRAPAELLRASD